MQIAIHPLDQTRRGDFYRLHDEACGAAWCFCVAWWVDSFAGWGERTAEQNHALREAVMDRGDFDGYLLYAGGEPAAWCQCAPRDRLPNLCGRYKLAPDPAVWAIGCFLVAPGRRGQGLAGALLAGVLADLRARGIARVEAFPKRGADLAPEDAWTGPEGLFLAEGFACVKDDPRLPIYRLSLRA